MDYYTLLQDKGGGKVNNQVTNINLDSGNVR